MAAVRYPAALPAFLAANYGRTTQARALRFTMEIGPARSYRVATTAPEFADCSTWLNQTQYDVFHDFYEDDLLCGEAVFNAKVRGPAYDTQFMEWWEARFAGPWRVTARTASRYLLAFRLRLISGPFLTEPV